MTGSLPPQQRRANSQLCFPLAPATVRRRFLREYRARVGDSGPERDAAHDVEQQSMQRQFDQHHTRCHLRQANSAIGARQQATLLLVYRRSDGTDLEQLEAPAALA